MIQIFPFFPAASEKLFAKKYGRSKQIVFMRCMIVTEEFFVFQCWCQTFVCLFVCQCWCQTFVCADNFFPRYVQFIDQKKFCAACLLVDYTNPIGRLFSNSHMLAFSRSVCLSFCVPESVNWVANKRITNTLESFFYES